MTVQTGKLLIVALVVCGLFAVAVAQVATWGEVSGPLGLLIGYVTGNGVNAVRGVTSPPIIGPHHRAAPGE